MASDVELTDGSEPGAHTRSAPGPAATASRSTWEFGRLPGASVTRPRWEIRYARLVVANDLLAIAIAVLVGHLLRLGNYVPYFGGSTSPGLGVVSGLVTVAALRVTGAWDPRVLGQGSDEFSRVLHALTASAVVVGLGGLALEISSVRPWVFGLIPLAGVLTVIGRYLLRRWLHRHRADGRFTHYALAVGTIESVSNLIRRTRRDSHNGWVVAGVCTPTGTGPDGAPVVLDVPVLGDLDSVSEIVRRGEHRVVAIGDAPGWSGRRLHQLAWDIEGVGADLVVDPGLMEIAGPRLHVAPVDGLPLLRLTEPVFTGVPRVVKNAIDWVGAAVLLVLVAPVLVAIAAVVKLDGGPVLFRQTRVGRHGKTFRMLKFRSMVVDAEARQAELMATNEGAGPLFKLKNDPRVTRVGAVLRKYSLDELPQLVNVLTGSMSLVGPRPPLPHEVATYSRAAERKLLVKPGLTGLWQVSGRSDLSWEEAVRLDLRYVENWTLAMDLLILWKTVGTLVRGNGAY
ncbi:sugar transferase [Pseudonocardia hispaniensis]|uniref:Sugar transferase n=1 Tax=Pseudonocardia hispaniensis TaxID=904933 RepID=A0ABW1J8K8_9PSEU